MAGQLSGKNEKYDQIYQRICALIEGETDLISVMSTISCELYHGFDYFNWVGFYRMADERTLKVGPYQGGHGCLVIDINRGVCGACVRSGEVQLVNEVSAVPDHIACSADTRAELVVPVRDSAGLIRAVLDIDSVQGDVFGDVDVDAARRICMLVSERY